MVQPYGLGMKKHALISMSVALTLALSACGNSPEEELALAQTHLQKHEFTEARLRLSNALKDDAENAEVLRVLALVQLELRDGVAALATKERLEKAGGQLDNPKLFEAEANVLKGQSDLALEILDGDKRAEAFRIRALALVEQGQFDAARLELLAGVDGEGPKAKLLADLSQFLLADGAMDDAAEAAALAVKEDPEALGSLLASAAVAAHQGKNEAALRLYDKATKNYPESRAALIGRIGMLAEAGQTDAAEEVIKAALLKAPQDRDLIVYSARMEADKGDWDEAKQQLQAIESDLRSHPDGTLLYATALLETGQGELAESVLENLVSRFPAFWRARGLLTEINLDRKDYNAAARLLRPYIEGEGDYPPEIKALIARLNKENGGSL